MGRWFVAAGHYESRKTPQPRLFVVSTPDAATTVDGSELHGVQVGSVMAAGSAGYFLEVIRIVFYSR